MTSDTSIATRTAKILVYSDDVDTRHAVLTALGSHLVTADVDVEWTEVASAPGISLALSQTVFDAVILDAEAPKQGGMSLSRQLKNELETCPPICLLIIRQQDAWLATWADADAIAMFPVDPFDFERTISGLLAK